MIRNCRLLWVARDPRALGPRPPKPGQSFGRREGSRYRQSQTRAIKLRK